VSTSWREFEPTAETIRQWIKQAGLDDGLRSDGLTTSASPPFATRLSVTDRLRDEQRLLPQLNTVY
jgi:transposase-like protein